MPFGLPTAANVHSALISGNAEFHVRNSRSSASKRRHVSLYSNKEECHYYEALFSYLGGSTLEDTINVNYEDVVAFLKTWDKEISGYPSVPGIAAHLERLPNEFQSHSTNIAFTTHLINFVESTLFHMLNQDGREGNHFDVFLDFLKANHGQCRSIATLNNDVLLEDKIRSNSSMFDDSAFSRADKDILIDGFRCRDERLQYSPSVMRKPRKEHSKGIPFLKLHGSIDWYTEIQERGGRLYPYQFRKESREQLEYLPALESQEKNGHTWSTFICGGSKEILYQTGIYADMFDAFIRELSESKTLITSGFSFNDYGLVRRILTWVALQPERKIVVLGGNQGVDEFRKNSRFGNDSEFKLRIENGDLLFIDKYLNSPNLDLDRIVRST